MAVTSVTNRRNQTTSAGKGDGNNLRAPGARAVVLTPSASGTVVDFKLRIPSDARIDGSSRLYWDDMATSGSPTFDLGLYAVDGNTTDDDDCLNDGLALSAVSTANVGAQVIKNIADFGKRAWELRGLTSDPGGFFDVKGIIRDAATVGASLHPADMLLDMKFYQD